MTRPTTLTDESGEYLLRRWMEWAGLIADRGDADLVKETLSFLARRLDQGSFIQEKPETTPVANPTYGHCYVVDSFAGCGYHHHGEARCGGLLSDHEVEHFHVSVAESFEVIRQALRL